MVDIDDRNGQVPNNISNRQKSKRASRVNTKLKHKIASSPPIQSLIHTLGLTVQWIRWDKTAHGWHVVIKVREKLTLAETIAAQAILGSDPARERLNLARCISLRKRPSKYWEARANILYSRKAQR